MPRANPTKPKITAKKYLGDDAGSWAVFIDGHPFVTGLTRGEVDTYKRLALQVLKEREAQDGLLRPS